MVMGALLVAWGQRANVCKPMWLVYPPLIMRESSLVFHMWKFRPTWGLLCFVMTAVCSSHTTWSRKKEWNQVTECDCDRSKIEASPTAVRIPISAKREISNWFIWFGSHVVFDWLVAEDSSVTGRKSQTKDPQMRVAMPLTGCKVGSYTPTYYTTVVQSGLCSYNTIWLMGFMS